MIDLPREFGKTERSINVITHFIATIIFVYILNFGSYETNFPQAAYYILIYLIAINIYYILFAIKGTKDDKIVTSFEKAIFTEIVNFILIFGIIICFLL